MPPPSPNPPGHRPYSSRPPLIPPQLINASTGQAKTARSYGYEGTIDLGADGVPKGATKNGQYVPFINGKSPEQIAEERATADASAQQQRVKQEQQAAAAQQAGVHDPQFDKNGMVIGGISKLDGQQMTMKNGQLVGDGKPNPQALQKYTQPATARASTAGAPTAAPKVPVDPAHSPAQSLLDVAAAARQDGPLGNQYGSARIIPAASAPPTIPSANDPQRTAANRIAVPGGGSVTVPAYNGGGAPDGGVYVNGKPMAHDASGALVADLSRASGAPPTVPTGTPGVAPAGQFAAGFKGVPAQTQALLTQMYPGLAQAGSDQHKQFMDALARTGSDGSDALSIAHTLFAPTVPTTPAADPAAAKQADEARVAVTQPGRDALNVAGQVQGQVRQVQTAQTVRAAAPNGKTVAQARAQVGAENRWFPYGAERVASALPASPATTAASGAAGAASPGSVAPAARTAAAGAASSFPDAAPAVSGIAATADGSTSPLKFSDAPKIGEMPKPLSQPTGMLSATTLGISGFGDNSVNSSKPPGIPDATSLDKPVNLTPSTGVNPPTVPTIPTPKVEDDDETKRQVSAETL